MPSKEEQGAAILAKAFGGAPEAAPMALDTPLASEPVAEAAAPVEDDDGAEEIGEITLNDLAEVTGVDVAELYDVKVNMGNDEPISIGKLKDAERRARQLEKQLRGLETEREQDQKELTNLRMQGTSPFGGMPAELDQMRMQAHQWHNYVYQNQSFWDRLKEEDPAQYMSEFTRAQQTATQAAAQFQQSFTAWQGQQRQLMNDFKKQQRKKLAEVDAAWADDQIRSERFRVISDWLREGNAQVPDNLGEVLTDPGWATRLYEAAAAAQKLKEAKTGAPRRVGTAKLKRGTLRRDGQSGGKLADLIQHAKKTGKSHDKRAAGEAILTKVFEDAAPKR